MSETQDFQTHAGRIANLVRELENIADPASRATTRELVQLLMELHGQGVERMMEIVHGSGDAGARIIDELGQDPLVSSLLVLYGIHPDDLETRVERKLSSMQSVLHKMGVGVVPVRADKGCIRLRIEIERHVCGTTVQSVRALLEGAMYEAAPDMTSLVIERPEEPKSSGFVGLEKLSNGTAAPVGAAAAEGMDS